MAFLNAMSYTLHLVHSLKVKSYNNSYFVGVCVYVNVRLSMSGYAVSEWNWDL